MFFLLLILGLLAIFVFTMQNCEEKTICAKEIPYFVRDFPY